MMKVMVLPKDMLSEANLSEATLADLERGNDAPVGLTLHLKIPKAVIFKFWELMCLHPVEVLALNL